MRRCGERHKSGTVLIFLCSTLFDLRPALRLEHREGGHVVTQKDDVLRSTALCRMSLTGRLGKRSQDIGRRALFLPTLSFALNAAWCRRAQRRQEAVPSTPFGLWIFVLHAVPRNVACHAHRRCLSHGTAGKTLQTRRVHSVKHSFLYVDVVDRPHNTHADTRHGERAMRVKARRSGSQARHWAELPVTWQAPSAPPCSPAPPTTPGADRGLPPTASGSGQLFNPSRSPSVGARAARPRAGRGAPPLPTCGCSSK